MKKIYTMLIMIFSVILPAGSPVAQESWRLRRDPLAGQPQTCPALQCPRGTAVSCVTPPLSPGLCASAFVCTCMCVRVLPQNKTQFDLLHWPVKLGCEAAPLFIPLMASLPHCSFLFPRHQLWALL